MPLILKSGGTLLDPVTELWELYQRDKVPKAAAATTPLFRRADGTAFKVTDVRNVVKWLMTSVGEDARLYGAHSLRIGGATAALAAGVPPATIRLMGRWSSDVYELYVRMTRQAAATFASAIGSTSFEDVERGAFTNDELVLSSCCRGSLMGSTWARTSMPTIWSEG